MQKWEYLFVVLRLHREHFHALYINGQQLQNWKQVGRIYEFSNQLGEEGWELVGKEGSLLVFKRPKPSD